MTLTATFKSLGFNVVGGGRHPIGSYNQLDRTCVMALISSCSRSTKTARSIIGGMRCTAGAAD